MKYLKQFGIILLISFIGEVCRHFIPLPIPASIYGLVLLFIALMTGVIKLESVKDASRFLIEIMPVMFIPAGVGLLESWGVLKPVFYPIVITVIISTIIVMVISGRVTQRVIRFDQKKKQPADINCGLERKEVDSYERDDQ